MDRKNNWLQLTINGQLFPRAQRVGYLGHVYFDTFPRNEDPVREAMWNVRVFKGMWRRAAAMWEARQMDRAMQQHDALGALELTSASEDTSHTTDGLSTRSTQCGTQN
jgi:hypothetical protein